MEAGRCALLIEDEFLVALETEAMLRDLGCQEIRSAASIAEALDAIRVDPPDFALVDVNLAGEQSWPVMQLLAEQGIPFAVTSGYAMGSEQLRAFGSPPLLRKPISSRMLANVIAALKTAGAGPDPRPAGEGLETRAAQAADQKSRSA